MIKLFIRYKRYLSIFLTCIFTACSSNFDDFLKNEENISNIIAHQGNWQYEGWKRNSVEAFKSALQWGFYGSECDVRMTKDSVFVIRHDDDFHGMKISSTHYEDLKGYVLDDEHLSTLDEFLNVLDIFPYSPTKLILDLKYVDLKRLLSKIENRNLENKIEFFCTRIYMNPLADMGYARSTWIYDPTVTPQEAAQNGMKGVSYNVEVLRSNEDIIDEIKSFGMQAGVWTVNDKETIKRYIGMGYIVTSDRPLQK